MTWAMRKVTKKATRIHEMIDRRSFILRSLKTLVAVPLFGPTILAVGRRMVPDAVANFETELKRAYLIHFKMVVGSPEPAFRILDIFEKVES